MPYTFQNIKAFREANCNKAVTIEVNNIYLTSKVHKQSSTEDLGKKENLMAIVHPFKDGYALITGWRDYQIALRDGETKIKALVVNIRRGDFMRNFKKKVKVGTIIVPKAFEAHPPKKEKIDAAVEFYRRWGVFDKPVTLKGNCLTDGYARLIAAQQLGVKHIPVRRERDEQRLL